MTTPLQSLNRLARAAAFACFFFLVPFSAPHAAVIYVDAGAMGGGTGMNWGDAYTDLQLALAAAGDGDEIWVANGVYKPSVEVDVDASGGMDPREVTFQIPSGVKLFGGFAGGEGSTQERDWILNPTILSGDIDNNDINDDANNIAETTDNLIGDNAYHVIYTQSVSAETCLDGFIVTAGRAGNGLVGFTPNRDGGGWYNDDNPPADLSSPTIKNSVFSGNYADVSGGALYFGSFTAGTYAPEILYSEFSGNEAVRSGGALYLLGDTATVEGCIFSGNATTAFSPEMETFPGSGGAVYLSASNAYFSDCVFSGNSASGNATGAFEGGGGGAVYANSSTSTTDAIGAAFPQFLNCGFYNNTTGGNGGAWGGAATHFSDGGNLSVSYVGCVFSGNTAADDGGAVACFARVIGVPMVLAPILEPDFTNCTFTGNNAGDDGGALFFDGYVHEMTEVLNALVENSILYGNSAGVSGAEVSNNAGNLVLYSLIEGSGGSGGGWDSSVGTDGGNNIDTDPQFVNAADPDGADNAPGTSDDGLFPGPGSMAIDAGNDAAPALLGVTADFAGGLRTQGAAVDMGAYETGPADNCPDDPDPDQTDSDCDGAGDVCDACPGGDDSIDNNDDDLPDCAFPPELEEIIEEWKCGPGKVIICHGGFAICVNSNAVAAHVAHGDFIGPCDGASCP